MITSLVVAWHVHLSPFCPKIFADTLVFHRLDVDTLYIVVSILFVNSGSQGGLIHDLAMSMQTVGGAQPKRMLWRALHRIYTDPLDWVRSTGNPDYKAPEVWNALYLEGRQQRLVRILFAPHGTALEDFDQDLEFSVGHYQARIRIYHSGKWKDGTNVPVEFDEGSAVRLAAGDWVFLVTTGSSFPTPDDFEPTQ